MISITHTYIIRLRFHEPNTKYVHESTCQCADKGKAVNGENSRFPGMHAMVVARWIHSFGGCEDVKPACICPVVLAGLFVTHVTVSDTPAHVVDDPVPALDGHARREAKRRSDPSRIVPVGDSIGVHVRPDTPAYTLKP